MQTKAENPITLLNGEPTSPWVTFYFELNHLKQLYRQGWLQRGMSQQRAETVAEHSFSLATFAMMIAETHFPQLDLFKVVRLALVHDLGEIYAGDVTPFDDVSEAERYADERTAILRLLEKLPHGDRYIALWDEFSAGETPEAKFVHQLDKLEFLCQATLYQKQALIDDTEQFERARNAITDPTLQAIINQLDGVMGR